MTEMVFENFLKFPVGPPPPLPTQSKFDATGLENPEKSLNSKKIQGLESP
jgi:hypothetical protein